MPDDRKEPESYGSERDWVSGSTGQRVGETDVARAPEHDNFYESRRESESSPGDQGGLSAPEWTDLVDVLHPSATDSLEGDSARNVTATFGGARREGFFRKRDYE